MTSKLFFTLFLYFLIASSNAQKKNTDPVIPDLDSLKKYEQLLHTLSDSTRDGSNEFIRMDACTDFIPLFVKTLKFRGSFNYAFDSLDFMHQFVAPDHSFRIFNWTLKWDNGTYRYYGAIQFNSTDHLKLIPLYDNTKNISFDMLEDTMLTNESWFGMQYYYMMSTKVKGRQYYILFGWEGNNIASHKKVIEVMYFKDGKVYFGAPIFKMDNKVKYRVILQYAATALVSIKYHPEKKLIVFDHLVPPDAKSEGKYWTYIPNGSYDYFRIKKGKLVFGKDVFSKYKIITGGPQ